MIVLDTAFQPVSAQLQVNYTFCLILKCYGILLEDWQFYKYLLRELITLNQNHETGHQNNMLSYDKVIKGHFVLVPIPRAASLGQIRCKEQDSK